MLKNKIINGIILIIGLFMIVNLTRSIKELYRAGGKIKEVEKEVEELKKKNEELKKTLKEVESQEYLEKIARDKLGLAKEGEVVVILPSLPPVQKTPEAQEENLANWQKWWKLFF